MGECLARNKIPLPDTLQGRPSNLEDTCRLIEPRTMLPSKKMEQSAIERMESPASRVPSRKKWVDLALNITIYDTGRGPVMLRRDNQEEEDLSPSSRKGLAYMAVYPKTSARILSPQKITVTVQLYYYTLSATSKS